MTARRVRGAAPLNVPGEFIGIDFSPDSRHLWAALSTGENSHSHVVSFDVVSGNAVVGFSADGTRAYSLGNEGQVRTWSVPDGDDGPTLKVPARHMQGPVTVVSPDGRWLATGSTQGALSVWSMEDLAPIAAAAAPSPHPAAGADARHRRRRVEQSLCLVGVGLWRAQ